MFKKSLIYLLSIGYAICLAVASLVEINTEAAFSIKHQDKIFHFAAYAVLCFLFFLSFYLLALNKSLLYAALLAFTFGTIIEFLQSITPYSRVSDVEDLFANTLGILTMVIILRWKKQTVVKKLQTFM